MIFASCLDGFCPVKLLQHHHPCQMVGEGHGAHGEPEVGFFFYLGADTEGRTDEETGAGLAGKLHILQLLGKGFAGQGLSFRGEVAKPCTLGDLLEDGFRFLIQPGGDLRGRGIFRKFVLRQFDQMEIAV